MVNIMLLDIYVLAKDRTVEYAYHFLDTWVKTFKETADDYEFPQYSDSPEIVYSNPIDLIKRLAQEPTEPHAIYWTNPNDAPISSAMLIFTIDGEMIVGISTITKSSLPTEHYLKSLADTVDGKLGLATFEEPPPDSAEEFKYLVISWEGPKLIRD